jgi:hypothetical protein
MLHFRSQVTSDVLQHYGPRLGVGGEIPLQCSNLPTHRASRLHCHRIDLGRNAAENQGGAYEVTGGQITQDTVISRDPNFPTDD